MIRTKTDNEGNTTAVRPIGARCIISRIFNRCISYQYRDDLRSIMGTNNCALDIVGCEKIAKAITVVLEANPHHVLLLPDVINAFNTIRRKLSLERLMEAVPKMTPALRYSYQVYAALIESTDQFNNRDIMGKSETGFTQGDPAALCDDTMLVGPPATVVT